MGATATQTSASVGPTLGSPPMPAGAFIRGGTTMEVSASTQTHPCLMPGTRRLVNHSTCVARAGMIQRNKDPRVSTDSDHGLILDWCWKCKHWPGPRPRPAETMRRCRRCGEVQPVDQFKMTGQHRSHICRRCQNAAAMARYRGKKEKE